MTVLGRLNQIDTHVRQLEVRLQGLQAMIEELVGALDAASIPIAHCSMVRGLRGLRERATEALARLEERLDGASEPTRIRAIREALNNTWDEAHSMVSQWARLSREEKRQLIEAGMVHRKGDGSP